jgi:Cof subfamily protein (haloacid dehalogenase superfamily)
LEVIGALGLRTPGIFLQGALVYDAWGRIQHQHTLAPLLVSQVVGRALAMGCTPMLYVAEKILSPAQDAHTAYIEQLGEVRADVLPDFAQLAPQQRVNKLVVWGPSADIPPLRRSLEARWGEAVRLVQALPRSLSGDDVPHSLEVLAPQVNKGVALREVLLDFRLQPEQVLAIGDGENDIEMLQTAGVGVAMGNAAPSVQAIADWVAPDHDSAGVAAALQRYVLG